MFDNQKRRDEATDLKTKQLEVLALQQTFRHILAHRILLPRARTRRFETPDHNFLESLTLEYLFATGLSMYICMSLPIVVAYRERHNAHYVYVCKLPLKHMHKGAPDRLRPPWGQISAEVSLSPRSESHDIINNIDVCQCQRERGWSSHNLTLEVVLTAMAWALKLVLGWYPWDNTAQVCAHCIDTKFLDAGVRCDDHIRRITLQALHKVDVASRMSL